MSNSDFLQERDGSLATAVQNTPAPALPQPDSPEYRAKGRRALGAAIYGFFVDMFDIYLPTIILTPAMVYFLPDDTSTASTAIWFSLIFVATILGRPLGSLIFGPLGDRIGRRKVTLIAAGGSAVCTGVMTVLPGYATIGFAAVVILIILRLVNGAFLGGEYSGANPLAMEYVPKHRRGLAGSLINLGYPLALVTITLFGLLMMSILPPGDAESAYAVWGWRIPFAVGFVLCTSLFFYYLTSVSESEAWKQEKVEGNPLKNLFSRRHAKVLIVTFIVGTGGWLAMNSTIGVFSAHFRGLEVADGLITATILVSAAIAAGLFPVLGIAGQRFGRRRVISLVGAMLAVVSSVGFGLAVSNRDDPSAFMLFGALAIIPGISLWSLITAFLMEQFPTAVRSSGYGISYSIPSILPACYAYAMLGLGNFMDYSYTPVILIAAAGAFILIGGWLSDDRRHIELDEI